MTTAALIPARGGSKGIKRKNIKNFCGKPLIYWSIRIALESELIDRVIVSTEDFEIAEIAKSFSAEIPFIRPSELSKDDVSGIAPVLHALENLPEIDDLILLQPTSPLRRLKDIEDIFQKRLKFQSDSAVSITKSTKNMDIFFQLSRENKLISLSNNVNIKPRQLYPDNYILNGSMYLSTRESIMNNRSLITDRTVGYKMPAEYSIDIDSYFDWEIAEYLMSKS